MSGHPELDAAVAAAIRWIDDSAERPIPASATIDDIRGAIPERIPERGAPAAAVIDELVRIAEPGLLVSDSPRFYGWVMGGALPAPLAADWLVSAWDQNAGMRLVTTGVVGVEERAGEWLLDLFGLPADAAVGFTTGATMANFSALAAARGEVLRRAGWDVERDGLQGAPRLRVLAGAERHGSVDLALRYLGFGAAELVAADEAGRLDAVALRRALAAGASGAGPTVVVLQAGNLHSGAFDPFADAISAAREAGAWVHVDGAFGLWALVSPRLAPLVEGLREADSWATDAHKTLNTPYDGGIVIVRDALAMRRAMGAHAAYLTQGDSADPFDSVPEMSRRARGVPVWAALASLGRTGVVALVDGLVDAAQGIARGVTAIPGATVLNDVAFTQVCVAFEDDARTDAILARILAEGEIRPSGSQWRGRHVVRFAVSDWRTDAMQVERTVDAVRRAAVAVDA